MKKLSTKGMKALKVIHLVCAIAWFGSAISMNLLRHLVEVEDAAGMFWVAEILEAIDLSAYLDRSIEEVSVGGESGQNARPCDFAWGLAIREQCVKADVPFHFHQTGARLIKDGKTYHIPRCHQHSQARKANINYRIGEFDVPETASNMQ